MPLLFVCVFTTQRTYSCITFQPPHLKQIQYCVEAHLYATYLNTAIGQVKRLALHHYDCFSPFDLDKFLKSPPFHFRFPFHFHKAPYSLSLPCPAFYIFLHASQFLPSLLERTTRALWRAAATSGAGGPTATASWAPGTPRISTARWLWRH